MPTRLDRLCFFPGPLPAPPPVPQSADAVERLLSEGALRLCDLGPQVGVGAGTLARWIVRGKRGLKLEAVRGIGKGYRTSRPAVARFLAAVGARG